MQARRRRQPAASVVRPMSRVAAGSGTGENVTATTRFGLLSASGSSVNANEPVVDASTPGAAKNAELSNARYWFRAATVRLPLDCENTWFVIASINWIGSSGGVAFTGVTLVGLLTSAAERGRKIVQVYDWFGSKLAGAPGVL